MICTPMCADDCVAMAGLQNFDIAEVGAPICATLRLTGIDSVRRIHIRRGVLRCLRIGVFRR